MKNLLLALVFMLVCVTVIEADTLVFEVDGETVQSIENIPSESAPNIIIKRLVEVVTIEVEETVIFDNSELDEPVDPQ